MTLAWAPPATAMLGGYAAVPVTVTGPAPVHHVVVATLGDGYPEWYFTQWDARGTTPFVAGPFRRRGRYEMTVRAVDEMGCEVSNGVRAWLTIQ